MSKMSLNAELKQISKFSYQKYSSNEIYRPMGFISDILSDQFILDKDEQEPFWVITHPLPLASDL